MDKRLSSLLVLCLCCVCWLGAQERKDGDKPEKKTRVDLLYADEAQADKHFRPDVQVLIGSVKLRHDSMYMFCDSALIYEKVNSVEAFGNVRMEQGDTLFIYGDYLYYDGMSQIAQLRENVRMINRNTELLTDSLNYDRVINLGYYFDGGQLSDEENVLTSLWGEYSPATKLAVFNDEVELVNPKFTLTSDTLKYSTLTKVATILGPSDIVSEGNHIYSERGIYNTVTEQAELLDRSVLTNESKKLTGDSLFYDRRMGYGEAFDNVVMNDTLNRNMLAGDYCFYNERTGNALATRRAVAVDYSQGDSLFMHGDTLRLLTFNLNTDSAFREMHAYHHVRAYRSDVQAVCDSLVYSGKDTCLTMYTDPILWHGPQQLLGEQIKVYMNDSTIDWAHIINQAMAVEQKDSVHYNQVTGKEMKALDDTKIIDLFFERDETAIRYASEKYGNRLRSLSHSIVKDRQTAEECENDTYMEAWDTIPPHEPRSYLYAFLARIIRHLSLNCCRDRSRLKRSAFICELSAEMEQCIPAPDDVQCRIKDKVFADAINEFLSRLDEEKRNIFVRRYWYLDSIASISERFALSQSKINTTLFRCRNELRKYLEKEGYSI